MASNTPTLIRHSPTYWQCDDGPALLAWLHARNDFHAWTKAANDTRRRTEDARFYHKPPGAQWMPAAGLVLERRKGGGYWVRLTGTTPERVARILATLEAPTPPEPPAGPEQRGLFDGGAK